MTGSDRLATPSDRASRLSAREIWALRGFRLDTLRRGGPELPKFNQSRCRSYRDYYRPPSRFAGRGAGFRYEIDRASAMSCRASLTAIDLACLSPIASRSIQRDRMRVTFCGVEGAILKTIRFVMFHTFRNGVDQPASMIEMAASSIRLSYPKSEIFLLSNLPNSETRLPDFIHTDLIDADCDSMMLSRIREYKSFIDRTSADGYVVFCDTDMLFVRRIDKLFKNNFDVAFTLRNDHDCPINGGFYLINMCAKNRISIFFNNFVEAIEKLPESQHYWNGDQTALARMLGAPAVNLERPCFARWNDIRIKYLPVRTYNNTPQLKQRTLHIFHPFARVLHFKASKKSFMRAYYRLYVTSALGKLLRHV